MIRVWPFQEAPAAFRDFPAVQSAARGRTPAWLAHREHVSSAADEALLADLCACWTDVPGNEVYAADAGGAGTMTLGCRSRPEAEEGGR